MTHSRTDFSLAETYGLLGRVVLVTGATRALGSGIAHRLVEAGGSVVVQYDGDETAAKALVESLEQAGGEAMAVEADLTSRMACHELVLAGARKFEHVDGLVNAAALDASNKFTDIDLVDWDAVMQFNLESPFYLHQAFAAHRSIGGFSGGAIVNVGAIMGQQTAIGRAHCATAAAALQTLTRAAALELGQTGIRVNAISPGLIDQEGDAVMPAETAERWQAAAPLQRLGNVDDIANAVVYLLSDASRWVTGSNLVVDGGVSCSPTW